VRVRFRSLLLRHGAALACLALPPILWLAPMLADPLHTVVGMEGDNLYYVRHFWWIKHALLDLHRSPFFDPSSYFPLGYALSAGELTPINTVLGLPITAMAGPIAAYNAAVLASFLLTGWATYAWAYRVSGTRAGAMLAAVIAQMAPYRLAHAAGHLPLISTDGFPLVLWSFEEYLAARRENLPSRSIRWAVALGVSLVVVALSSWYYAYSLALLLPLYGWLRMRTVPGLWRSRAWWGGLMLAAGIAAVFVTPFVVPYLQAARAGGMRKSFYEMLAWSLNFYDFILPNIAHPWWSSAMRVGFPREAAQWAERSVSLGYVALILAGIGFYARDREARSPAIPALVCVGIVAALIALGPLLHSGDRPVLLPMPYIVNKTVDWVFARVRPYSWLRAHLWTQQVFAIPLPSLLLFLLVPGTSGMRVMARFVYWTLLMTAAMAALGARALIGGAFGLTRNAGAAIVGIAIVAVVFESWSPRAVSRWEPRAVDRWVAEQSLAEVVVELPLSEALRPAQDYYVTVQQRATVFGPIGDSFQPPALADRTRALSEPPTAAAIDTLRRWGTTIVLVNTSRGPDGAAWQRALAESGVRSVADFEGIRVYRLD
jgi:hypothetical protein